MSKREFTKKEIKILSTNPNVKSVGSKGITYTDEFKRQFIVEHESGKLPRDIFESHGFDVEMIGSERVLAASKRWRAAYKEKGVEGLRDTRKENSGRPREKDLSLEEKYERLKVQNNLLKAENELLKKIEMGERRLRRRK
ncbi:hypothetical protein GMB86_15305 [Terrilactibacillus sp. BCM23-1]|uniref:Uncharacterized protein n=1 Tax=Terrilactibacillus tamarindi TaxID=2599694 RepID=A0A6N8CT57_9BACI|nr:hypothetical protein [Terrilactibacillus tamarindi]